MQIHNAIKAKCEAYKNVMNANTDLLNQYYKGKTLKSIIKKINQLKKWEYEVDGNLQPETELIDLEFYDGNRADVLVKEYWEHYWESKIGSDTVWRGVLHFIVGTPQGDSYYHDYKIITLYSLEKESDKWSLLHTEVVYVYPADGRLNGSHRRIRKRHLL